MLLRPYACVIRGEVRWGVEVEVVDGVVTRVGVSAGVPDDYVLCPAFVNAHSHFEYRGLLGRVGGDDFFAWIREITAAKSSQELAQVAQDCQTAADENRLSGVAYVWEHSDRPGSGMAMKNAGLNGVLFQELITFNEHSDPGAKMAAVHEKAAEQFRASGIPAYVNPHAIYTVDSATLKKVVHRPGPLSVHCAESRYERMLTVHGEGPFADFQRSCGWDVKPEGMSPVALLNSYGYLRPGTQLVHCCDVDESDIARIARMGASVAHCPRSNLALSCPVAPVKRMLEAGVPVGLGMDSAASSGPIDMFEEMRCAMEVSRRRGEGLEGEEVLWMATGGGARSLRVPGWEIEVGSRVPLLKIGVDGIYSAEELIERGSAGDVEWV
jgi:aminodeoxyfutalosine deaminase